MAKKLLIIDDEEDILTYLVTVFEENGYEVNTASDGKEGLKKLGHDKPDLICLDLLMPNKSGIAFYRAIRKDSSFKEIPVVIVTGFNKNDYPTADMEKFIYEPSVPLPEDYLEKPIDKKQLLDTVNRILTEDQAAKAVEYVRFSGKIFYLTASGFRLAADHYYHPGHAWARIENDETIRVGFDDFLVKVFGTAQEFEIPPQGAALEQGMPGLRFTRDGRPARLLSPVSGTVTEINEKILESPEFAFEKPYEEGWLFSLAPSRLKTDIRGLYFGEESVRWMEKEVNRLMKLIGHDYEKLASTGGEPIKDIVGRLPETEWERFERVLLLRQ